MLDALDGARVDDFTFAIENLGDDGRRADLKVTSPLGSPMLGAKVELARHELSLQAEWLAPVALPIHSRYGFELPILPVVRTEEAIAEKLARYRRVPLARDLYDLYWYANSGALDEALIRRLWVLKTYRDIVVDGRGTKPIDPSDVLRGWRAEAFRNEDIGYLTRPVRMDDWLRAVTARYAFIADLSEDEQRWAPANARHLAEVTAALGSLKDP